MVADELTHGTPAHVLVGLSTADGKVELSQNVDPTGADPAALLQRTGLTLDQGRVVFGMGGNYGDCSTYRGRVISVPEAGGQADVFTVDAAHGESQGAVWMGGAAPVVDASGDVWVTAGNGSVYSASHAYDDSDSLLELSPSMMLIQYFAPSTWPSDNASDLDMSTGAALLPDGQVIVAAKSRIAYLVNGSSLGGIGKEEASLSQACNDDIDGGIAFVGTTAYLPCESGTTAVSATTSPARLHLLWTSSAGGGPPIVAAGLVWTMGQNGVLYGLDPATGAVRQQASVGTPRQPLSDPVRRGRPPPGSDGRPRGRLPCTRGLGVVPHVDVRRADEHRHIGLPACRHRQHDLDLGGSGRRDRRPSWRRFPHPPCPAHTPEELIRIREHPSDQLLSR